MPSIMVYVNNDIYSALLKSGEGENKTPSKKAAEIISSWYNQKPGEKKNGY